VAPGTQYSVPVSLRRGSRILPQTLGQMEAAVLRFSSRDAANHYDEIYSSTLEWSQERNENFRNIFGGILAFGREADISAKPRNKFEMGLDRTFLPIQLCRELDAGLSVRLVGLAPFPAVITPNSIRGAPGLKEK